MQSDLIRNCHSNALKKQKEDNSSIKRQCKCNKDEQDYLSASIKMHLIQKLFLTKQLREWLQLVNLLVEIKTLSKFECIGIKKEE